MKTSRTISQCSCYPISRRTLFAGALSSLGPDLAGAQNLINIDLQSSCSFYPEDKISSPLYSFDPTQEAETIVKRITNSVGLAPNFKLLQANVPNASAVIEEQQRLILYSLVFIQLITKSTATEWAAWTILAHEIGHHLNGHTLLGIGSRPPLELQADHFAGHAVRRMGGRLDQALAAYGAMSAAGTVTQPHKSARLEAVTKGWTEALQVAFNGAVPRADEGEAALRDIVESLRAGRRPSKPMAPALSAASNGGTHYGWDKLRNLGVVKEISKQGQHAGADGISYTLYSIVADNSRLSCVMGTNASGILTTLYFN